MLKRSIKIIILFICFVPFFEAKGQTNDSLIIGYNYINSTPQNSQVFLNDSLVGFTPFYFMTGKDSQTGARLEIKQKGYIDYVINTEAGEKINRTVVLVPSKPGMLIKSPVQVNKSQFFAKPRKILPIVITSSLAAGSGILSYYFKKMANDNYTSFGITGDPAALNRKKKYDLISGISLGVFQVSFAGLLYYLFINN